MMLIKLIFWIIFCQLPAMAGGSIAAQNYAWYQTLNLPAFTPPTWLFAPVWTVLYVLMGTAIFLVTKNGLNKENRSAVMVFIAQLAVNALWMPTFFGRHDITLAFLLMFALFALTIWTMKLFWPLSKHAFWLLTPYILWLAYATFLYGFIWKMN